MARRKEAADMGEASVSFIGNNLSDLSILARINLSKCQTLILHNNLLRNLHGIPVLDHLTELNLSSNNITDCKLPELSSMPLLTSLDLSANKLTSIQFYPSRLPNLEILSVAYNAIISIQGLDFSCPNLIRLDLCGNEIYDIQDILCALSGFSRLQSLSIKGNPVCPQISRVSEIFDVNPSLQFIDDHPHAEWLNAERTVVFTPKYDRIRDEIMSQLVDVQRAHQQAQLQQVQPVSLFGSPLAVKNHQQQQQFNSQTPWSPEPLMPVEPEVVIDHTAENNLKKYLILNRYLRLGAEAEFQSMNVFFQSWKTAVSLSKTESRESAWRSEVEALKSAHAEEVRDLQSRVEQLERERDESTAALTRAESEAADLRRQLETLRGEKDTALVEVTTQLKAQWSSAEQALLQEKAALSAENEQLQQEVERCGASVESIEAMTAVLREQLRLHQTNEQHLEQLHSVTQSELTSVKESLKASEERHSALMSEHTALLQSIALQKEAFKSLQDSLSASEVCREALKIEFQTYKSQSATQQTSHDSLKREEEVVLQQLRLDKANLTETVGKLETRLMKMHAAMEQLKLQHSDALMQQSDLVEKQQREEKKCVDLLADCRKLQEVAEVYKGEAHKATKYKKQLTSVREQLEETTERLKKAEASANEWRDKCTSANVVVDSLKDTLRELQHTVKDLQLDNDRLAAANKIGLSEREELLTKLSVKDKIIDDKMHLSDELKKKLTQASADLVTLRDSCVELEGRLIATSEELAARDKQLEAKIFSNNRLKTILLELHKSNSEPVGGVGGGGGGGGVDVSDGMLHLNASDDESIFLMLEKANSRMMKGKKTSSSNSSSGGGGVDVGNAFQGLDLSASIDFS